MARDMKPTNIILILLFLSTILVNTANGQVSSDDKKLAQAVAEKTLKEGDDIKFGAGMLNYSLKSTDGSQVGSNYNQINTFSLYGAYTTKSHVGGRFFIEYDIQLGKRFFSQKGMPGDEINLLTCDEYTHYYAALPVKLTYHHLQSKFAHLSYSFGVYAEVSGMGEFKNEKGNRMVSYAGSDIHGFDWGLNFGLELGFYGAFISANYQFGYRDLAGRNTPGWEMKNKIRNDEWLWKVHEVQRNWI